MGFDGALADTATAGVGELEFVKDVEKRTHEHNDTAGAAGGSEVEGGEV